VRIEVPPVGFTDLDLPPTGDSSATVAERVEAARAIQADRFRDTPNIRQNADVEGNVLEEIAAPDAQGKELLLKAAERFGLSARAFHRILRVARTIADLEGEPDVRRPHVAEALSFRISAKAGA
jgi:magnesium chelatase family protein